VFALSAHHCACQGYGAGAGAQVILDGCSRSQNLLDGGAGAWIMSSASTGIVCGASELYR